MNILRLLTDKNPHNDVQTIQFLAKSGSPYAIELLKELAQRSKDEKMREYSKKAMLHVRKQVMTEAAENKGKRQKLTDLSIHIEILMALAMVTLDDFQQSKVSKRAVARAYSMDSDLLNNPDYQDVATQVFHNSLQGVEEELQSFVIQEVKNHRTLKSSYPFYMYFVDVPVVMILGGAMLAAANWEYVRRFAEWQWENNEFLHKLNIEVLGVVALILIFLVAGRLLVIIIEQTRSKKVSGWEKEARLLAIAHLEDEIKKLSAAR
jgi:hypothetical protein